MPIRRSDFDALTGDLQDIFEETSNLAIARMGGLDLFGVQETELYDYVIQNLHGLKGIRRVGDSENLPRIENVEGDQLTLTQRHYGAIVPVSKEMRKFDRYDKAYGMVETVVDEGWNGIDQTMADVLLQGWSTSYTDYWGDTVASVGPDSLALFSKVHSNPINSNTFNNIMNDGTNDNPSLSRTAVVQQIATAKVMKDVNNLVRPVRLDTVIVPPSLEDEARRILYSDKISGSANNDTNMMLRSMKLIVWERLEAAADGTDTSAYWFMCDSQYVAKTLRLLFAERPSLDPPEEVYANKDWEYSVDFFYTLGTGYPMYIFGSNGTNS